MSKWHNSLSSQLEKLLWLPPPHWTLQMSVRVARLSWGMLGEREAALSEADEEGWGRGWAQRYILKYIVHRVTPGRHITAWWYTVERGANKVPGGGVYLQVWCRCCGWSVGDCSPSGGTVTSPPLHRHILYTCIDWFISLSLYLFENLFIFLFEKIKH